MEETLQSWSNQEIIEKCRQPASVASVFGVLNLFCETLRKTSLVHDIRREGSSNPRSLPSHSTIRASRERRCVTSQTFRGDFASYRNVALPYNRKPRVLICILSQSRHAEWDQARCDETLSSSSSSLTAPASLKNFFWGQYDQISSMLSVKVGLTFKNFKARRYRAKISENRTYIYKETSICSKIHRASSRYIAAETRSGRPNERLMVNDGFQLEERGWSDVTYFC